MTNPILSILICTTLDRRELFKKLYLELFTQARNLNVEVIYEEDAKQISVGAKRQKLLLRAQGKHIVYFDSDDWPFPYYVSEILKALEDEPDCVGFLIHMTTNGRKPQVCCHSLQYPTWKGDGKTKIDGYDYVRNVTHFNPICRDLALQVGFKDIRFGEDRLYSDAVTQLCKTEVFINKKLFHYRYSNLVPHRKKYGFSR
jgi:hypothetical protein